MMLLGEALEGRRSTRRFTKEPVSDEVITELIEAGVLAPSSCNLQAWRVKVLRGKQAFELLAQKMFLDAPVTLAVYCLVDKYPAHDKGVAPLLDTGFFIENILLKAFELGLGACPSATAFDQAKARKTLGLPENGVLTAFVALGWPDEHPVKPPRLKPSEVIDSSEVKAVELKASLVKQAVVVLLLPVLVVKWWLQRGRVKRETGVDQTIADKTELLLKRKWW